MKLSEAIRLGAMLKPQAFDVFTDGTGTCAFGAALEAIGLRANSGVYHDEGWVVEIKARCPAHGCRRRFRVVGPIILHLNDDHRWTREQIADWVETIEAQQPVESQPVPVEM